MAQFRINITKRKQTRRQRDGSIKEYDRYVLQYRDPKTGKRVQQFYSRQKEAYDAQRQIVLDHEQGTLYDKRQVPTLEVAFDSWIADREGQIKPYTLNGYKVYRMYIIGPLLKGTTLQRRQYAVSGKMPKGCSLVPMLGNIKLNELTTADIRAWHKQLGELVGAYTAGRAMQRLKTILDLTAEDYNIRPPAMPRRLGRGRAKEKKAILLPEQVKLLLRRRGKTAGRAFMSPSLSSPASALPRCWPCTGRMWTLTKASSASTGCWRKTAA